MTRQHKREDDRGPAGYDARDAAYDLPRGARGASGRTRFPADVDYRGMGPRGYVRSDERIREDLCERLTADRYIDARAIVITIEDGDVTLAGSVADAAAKHRAEDIAESTPGVKAIDNQLRIGRAASARRPHTGAAPRRNRRT